LVQRGALVFDVLCFSRNGKGNILLQDVQTCTGPIHRSTLDELPPIGRLVIFRKETLQGRMVVEAETQLRQLMLRSNDWIVITGGTLEMAVR